MSKPNVHVVKFDQAEQPIFKENKSRGIVEFGVDNDYPDYLTSLFKESPKHAAIIKGKTKYIFGKGFAGLKTTPNTTESWDTLLRKCVLDYELFGGYYLQMVYNVKGQVADIYHLKYRTVRVSADESEYHVKKIWSKKQISSTVGAGKEQARVYSAFNNKYDPKKPIRVLFVKQYSPACDTYPLPEYFGALNYIASDVEIGRYILGNALQGWSATKAINLNNGEPAEEEKEAVETELQKKFGGSKGKRFVLVFNSSKDNAMTIDDLGSTMFSKEDFTNINNLVQQEIYAGHEVTSPMLFGIKTEGQLGGRSEMQDAYEIFNNTYVNARQQEHEDIFNGLLRLKGEQGDFSIVPLKPLGFTLKDELLLDILPREYFLDELGVDVKYYALPPARLKTDTGIPGGAAMEQISVSGDISGTPQISNEVLRNLSGRQRQGLMSIANQYKKQKLTREQAVLLLKSGYNLSDADCDTFLVDATAAELAQFSDVSGEDDAMLLEFGRVGEARSAFKELSRQAASEVEYFGRTKKLDSLQSGIVELIKKDKRIDPATMADVLKESEEVVKAALADMVKGGVLKATTYKNGNDITVEREAVQGVEVKPTELGGMLLRYSYDGPQDSKNRPFCAKLLELNRLYSRADIEQISERLGYSVWDRRGGWFTEANGDHRPYCRHDWNVVIVQRK